MRFFLNIILLMGVIVGLTFMAGYALQNNGLPDLLAMALPKVFDEDHGQPKPEETLQAPFADPALRQPLQENSLGIAYTPPTNVNTEETLSVPHRTKEELSAWLINAVSEVLNVDPVKYAEHLKFLETGMDPYAIKDYDAFMKSTNILPMLEAKGMEMRSFVEEDPSLLNAGVLEGRYRWLFEMPVTLSFLPRNTTSYRQLDQSDLSRESVIVKVQIGRSTSGQAEGVVIETWEARRRKNTTPKAQ